MYETFYKLKEEPFRLSPDHRFSSRHPSYARAADYLHYGVERAEGMVMITGAPGTGKSTLVGDLIDGISARVLVANLVITQLEGDDLLRAAAYRFGLRVEGLDKATVLHRIEDFLIQQSEAERRVLLVVDEAQDLAPRALEELRLLTNLQLRSQPLLQVFLLGQEGLLDIVNSPSMEQLQQRIIAACHLEPLNAEETRTYVENRLEHAGWQGDPQITDDAFALIHEFSNGVPRRINLLTGRLLLYGSVDERHDLNGEDVQNVIEDLRSESLIRDEERGGGQAVKGGSPPRKTGGQVPDLRPLPSNAPRPTPVTSSASFSDGTQSKPQPQQVARPFPRETSAPKASQERQGARPEDSPSPAKAQDTSREKSTTAPQQRRNVESPAEQPAQSGATENRSQQHRQNSRAPRREPAFPEASRREQASSENAAPQRPAPPPPSPSKPTQTHNGHAGSPQSPRAAVPQEPAPASRPAADPPPARTRPSAPRRQEEPEESPESPPRSSRHRPDRRSSTPSLFADARTDRLDFSDTPYPELDEDEPPAYGRWVVGVLIALAVLVAFYVLNPEESQQFIGAVGGWLGGLMGGNSAPASG